MALFVLETYYPSGGASGQTCVHLSGEGGMGDTAQRRNLKPVLR